MNSEDIRLEVEKLRRRHKIQKWTDLSLGLALVIGGFAAIASPEIRSFIPENPAILLPPVGGAIIGVVAKNWRGSPALRALEKSVS